MKENQYTIKKLKSSHSISMRFCRIGQVTHSKTNTNTDNLQHRCLTVIASQNVFIQNDKLQCAVSTTCNENSKYLKGVYKTKQQY